MSIREDGKSSGNGKCSITNLSENQDSDGNLSEGGRLGLVGGGEVIFAGSKEKRFLAPSLPLPYRSLGSFSSEPLSLVIEAEWEASMMELERRITVVGR